MGYLITYFIIITYAIMLTIILNKRIEEVLPISIVEIILIIFISGLFDNLKIGITIIEILAILQLIFILIMIIKKDKEIVWRILTPGLLVYTLLFSVNILINKNRVLEDYDEFNHWAVIVKNMFLYNTYGTNEQAIVTFNEYPPFTAIFQYLFLMIQKVYREDTIIIAQNVLYFSIMIPITKNVKWNKSLTKLFVILPVIVLLPIFFYKNFYLEILVDGIIGIMFAYVVFSAVQKEEDIKFKYLKVLAGEIMLVLTKTSSIALALLAILIIFMEKIIFGLKKDKQKSKKEIRLILIVFIIALLITALWYLKVSGAEKRWDFEQIIKIDSQKAEENSKVALKFIQNIFLSEKITSRQFTVFSVTLLLICLQIYVTKRIKEREIMYYEIAMLISIPIWLIGLLLMYVTIFDMHEAIYLTCFERYVSTILLANATFQMFSIVQIEEKHWKKQAIIIFLILVSLMPLSNIEEKYINGKNYIVMSNTNRNIFTQLKKYKNQLKTTDKILYIVGKNSKEEYLTSMNNYEIMPVKIEQTIRGSFEDADTFKNIVKNYTHVFIYQIEDEEKEKIKEMFENDKVKTDVLYKVKNENNQIKLELER